MCLLSSIIIYIRFLPKQLPHAPENQMDSATKVTNLAFFLQEKTGSVFGYFSSPMLAKDQRALFGQFIGKGKIVIDGESEHVKHVVSRCFGLDYEVTFEKKWAAL
jgi:hypothetical protein